MADGLNPTAPGLRRVTPGSNSIINRLKELELLGVYEQAGFEVGAPGCSYCVGMGVDKAGKGEVWLSSQNRNYRDRMGPGSIANIASAATVAISSFSMSLQSPEEILQKIDMVEFDSMRRYQQQQSRTDPEYVEPELLASVPADDSEAPKSNYNKKPPSLPETIEGRIQRFGDNVDTDSLIPTDKCHSHLFREEGCPWCILLHSAGILRPSTSWCHNRCCGEEFRMWFIARTSSEGRDLGRDPSCDCEVLRLHLSAEPSQQRSNGDKAAGRGVLPARSRRGRGQD